MFLLFYFSLFFMWVSADSKSDFEIDYLKANTNPKKHYQVPQHELIFIKYQADEPMYFHSKKERGHGYLEPIQNVFINKIRQAGIYTYVNYFTSAKAQNYEETNNYESCRSIRRPWREYKHLKETLKKNKNKIDNKFVFIAIPYNLNSAHSTVAIKNENIPKFEKHKFNGTHVYSVKSLLDDENLKTIQIIGLSSAIRDFIYVKTSLLGLELKPEYKKRVYEFVSSSSDQIPQMLNGNRMHWVEMAGWGDFYIKKFGLDRKISIYEVAPRHPKELTKDDIRVDFIRCFGSNRIKMQKIVGIINEQAKILRGNKAFWEQVLRNYALDFGLSYVGPEDFYYIKGSFINNKELINGAFD